MLPLWIKRALKRLTGYDRWGRRGEALYLLSLKDAVEGCSSILDMGCGRQPLSLRMAVGHRVFLLDMHAGSVTSVCESGVYRVVGDVRYATFRKNSVDAVLLLQVLEHLDKRDGGTVLRVLESIARKVVVVSTPNGFVAQEEAETARNPFQQHCSGWSVADLEAQGYHVTGCEGFKAFKRPGTSENRFPQTVFALLSGAGIGSGFLASNPSHAFQLLAVKRLDGVEGRC